MATVTVPIRTTTWIKSIQLCHRLEITPMTLYLWRKGKANEDKTWAVDPLPSNVKGAGNAKNKVLFSVTEVEGWLKKYKPAYVQKLKKNKCSCRECKIKPE